MLNENAYSPEMKKMAYFCLAHSTTERLYPRWHHAHVLFVCFLKCKWRPLQDILGTLTEGRPPSSPQFIISEK